MMFRKTLVKSFYNNELDAMYKGIRALENSNVNITNTVIRNMQQTIKDGELYSTKIESSGSAIEIIDSNVTMNNCTFFNNTAISGGAISISCDYLNP